MTPSTSVERPDQLVVEVTPATTAIRAARRRARAFFADRGVGDEVIERSQLVLAELLTNALEATPPDEAIVISITEAHGDVTIEVANRIADPRGLEPPDALDMPGPDADRGRGLPLVAACANQLAVTTAAEWVTFSARIHHLPAD